MKPLSDEALKQICKVFTYYYQKEKTCIFKDNKLYIHDSIDNTETLVATLESGEGVDGHPIWYGFVTITGLKFIYDFCHECVLPVQDFIGSFFCKPAQYGLNIHNSRWQKIHTCPFHINDKIQMFDGPYTGTVVDVDEKYFYVKGDEIAPKIPICMSYAFYKVEDN